MIYEKIIQRRTIRKYSQKNISKKILLRCVDAARVSPSSGNIQPLKYIIVNHEGLLKPLFHTLPWASLLPEYFPLREEMPKAYIIILLDKQIKQNVGHDAGIAAMTISMVAHDEGLGSCIHGISDKNELCSLLKIPPEFDVILVVSLGYPIEKPIEDKIRQDDTKYWLDEQDVLHIPKRDLKEIMKFNYFKEE